MNKLWQQFLKTFPLESLSTMTLSEYTNLTRDDAFIYWLEVRTLSLGGIGGGSAFKFGIYRRDSSEEKKNEKGRCYNDDYAWYRKYGETQDQAWSSVKAILLQISKAAAAGDLAAIDSTEFSESVKWKIAFLYQNQHQYSVLNIFKHEALIYLCEEIGVTKEGKKSKSSYPELYLALLDHYKDEAEDDMFGLAGKLWNQWDEREDKEVVVESDKLRHWIVPLQSALLDYREVASHNYVSSENYPEGFSNYISDIEISKGDKIALCDENNILSLGQVDELQQSGPAWVQTPHVFSSPLLAAPSEIRKLTPSEISDIWGAYELARPRPKAQNLILYGPPGTGKTYSVIERALRLVLPEESYSALSNDRKEMARFFSKLQTAGQIEFVTFHQSYSYEEFVEGLRPVISDEMTGDVSYEIHKGILKRIAVRARTSEVKSSASTSFADALNENPTVWKISLKANNIDGLKEDCFENGLARIGWDSAGNLINDTPTEEQQIYRDGLGSKNQSTLDSFSSGIMVGDMLVSLKDQKTADAVGIVTKAYYYNEGLSEAKNCLDVNWVYRGDIDIYKMNGDKNLTLQTVYRLTRIKPEDLLSVITGVRSELQDKPVHTVAKQYVLIIDEINRGNLSKIFGELITLLEPSKRIGQRDALKLRLPYSNDEFALPSNLHLIGTMNTADRSIALMDVALRRRFQFEELMPDDSVIRDVLDRTVPDSAFVHLVVDIFNAINQRIRFLYDRDHQLGHAYFLDGKDYERLKHVLLDRVIPLLQEYFYGNWEKISLVLGCPYGEESGQPLRKSISVSSGGKYTAPLISASTLGEEATFGFNHDEFESRVEYAVNRKFKTCADDFLIEYFLNILELSPDAHSERLEKLKENFGRFSENGNS